MRFPTVPLYVLCGPLGAGKTTLLMRLLEYWREQGKRVGVLMNEAGEVSFDGPRAAMKAVAVYDITGGCVCCDARYANHPSQDARHSRQGS